jgi:serine/threonine-protein kinase
MEAPASQKRWLQAQRLFAEVVGLDDERRSARLDRVEDLRLRQEVAALLERHARGESIEAAPAAAAPRAAPDDRGEVVGHYRVLDELGRGAMGVVYRAEDMRLKRPVALKFLTAQLSADKRARARLEREAQAASALDHPNICTVYEIGETDDGRLYLALACYDGETLARRVERGPLEVKEAVRIAVHTARGLAAAHRHGIVHRDVKPSNILVTDDGAVKLLDFGIARIADSDLTGTGDALGTVAYMSPEQLRGGADARADVWALGVVLYEMLAGHRPFGGDYEAALLYAILHGDPPPLDRDGVSADLAAIVDRCLDKDPDARYQSAEEVEVALERLGLGSASRSPVQRLSRRKQRLAGAAGGVALVFLLFLLSPLRPTAMGWLGLADAPGVQHLAVLPLRAAEEGAIGEGLTLTLTSLLTQLGAHAEEPLTVVPASEMRAIATAAEARERFGVDVVVSGDFKQENGQARLTLNLVDARSLRQLGSERLSEPDDRLPYLQQRALAAVVAMLGASLSADQEARLTEGGTMSADAYVWYLKGEAALDQFDQPEKVDVALELFQWAVDEDSLFALAHAGLGEAAMRKYEDTRDVAWVERAEAAGRRALRLANRLAEVRVTLGMLNHLTGDHSGAIREFGLALEIDPANADGYFGLASTLAALGRAEQAESNYERSLELQPNYWPYHSDYGVFLLHEGRYREAVRRFERVIELEPDNVFGYTNLGSAYLYLEEWDLAEDALQEANAIMPTADAYSNLGFVYYVNGRFEEEARIYERALALDSTNYTVWGNLASAYLRAGAERDQVRSAYERAASLAQRHLAVNPHDAATLVALADYQLSAEDRAAAAATLGRAVNHDGLSVDLMADIGTLYERLGDRAQALKWLRLAQQGGYSTDHLDLDANLRQLLEESASSTLK